MPHEENEILIYWHDLKLLKVQFVIYVILRQFLKKLIQRHDTQYKQINTQLVVFLFL